MEYKSIKWLVYTVLVGLIPILSRLLLWTVTKQGTVELFSAADFVVFGLVLHISNINEIEHLSLTKSDDKSWKTVQNGISILFITFYGILFCLTLLSGPTNTFVDEKIITNCAILLSLVSFLLSYSVFYRISRVSAAGYLS
jgi:hypothetical protein